MCVKKDKFRHVAGPILRIRIVNGVHAADAERVAREVDQGIMGFSGKHDVLGLIICKFVDRLKSTVKG
jgi:hypothetical protein